MTALVEPHRELGLDLEVAFCPERIAEGKALEELFELPQIVSARAPSALERARKLFEMLTPEIVEMLPEEAELAKLYTNTYRYLKFATRQPALHDGQRLRAGLRTNTPRGHLPLPPCRRPTSCRVCRRAVPAQGHDATGGFQQQQFRSGACAR